MLNQEVLPSPHLAVPGYKDEHGSSTLYVIVISSLQEVLHNQGVCCLYLKDLSQVGRQNLPS